MGKRQSSVAIVIVNWQGAADTIACLKSIRLSVAESTDISVVIVDNASEDDSASRIEAEISRSGWLPQNDLASSQESDRVTSERWFGCVSGPVSRICLVRARENYGYAAGNNIGYRIAEAVVRPEFVWHLNNDTEVRSDTLLLLLRKMQCEPDICICGATLVYFDNPEVVQAFGGFTYSILTGRGAGFGAGTLLSKAVSNSVAEDNIDYVSGASMFVRCTSIEKLGLMSEDYFLYNEEIDWAWRARGRFRLGVETSAVVLHKEGNSIGTQGRRRSSSSLANFFQTRSKLRFASKHMPWCVPTVWLALFARFCKQLLVSRASVAVIILQVLLGRRTANPAWFKRNR